MSGTQAVGYSQKLQGSLRFEPCSFSTYIPASSQKQRRFSFYTPAQSYNCMIPLIPSWETRLCEEEAQSDAGTR